jgi:superoxide dismutase
MDVWEHAYMVDHKATQRPDYITEFMKNIYWDIVVDRYNNAKKSKRQ